MTELLEEREEDILNFIVRDFIHSAAPVSSNRVCDTSKINLSPASIRNTMLALDEEGYLEKPHSSAGRVPTDKAYRYFVDHLMHEYKSETSENAIGKLVKNFSKEHELIFEKLAKTLSLELGLFCASASFGERVHAAGFGFSEIMDEPEFSDREMSLEFAKLVDNLENLAEQFFEASEENCPRAFIGKENPSGGAKSFSSVALKFNNGKSSRSIVFSIGPKRMNYERAFSLLKGAARNITGET